MLYKCIKHSKCFLPEFLNFIFPEYGLFFYSKDTLFSEKLLIVSQFSKTWAYSVPYVILHTLADFSNLFIVVIVLARNTTKKYAIFLLEKKNQKLVL